MTGAEVPGVTADSIRAVLWKWDQIGVKAIGSAWPPGEYGDLIEPLQQTLRHSPTANELAGGLHEILTVHCSLPSPHGCADVAATLLRLGHAPSAGGDH